ncbi:MAG: hypothetical protein K6F61_04080 [Clostridiales bacterium]|nr:hypothetical protein [Clostridiales bacterium]
MELKDTINDMVSGDYKDRFKAEYHQTKIRYERLKKLNTKIEAAEYRQDLRSQPLHDCPLHLLSQQQHIMGEYLHVLEVRAAIEGIEL